MVPPTTVTGPRSWSNFPKTDESRIPVIPISRQLDPHDEAEVAEWKSKSADVGSPCYAAPSGPLLEPVFVRKESRVEEINRATLSEGCSRPSAILRISSSKTPARLAMSLIDTPLFNTRCARSVRMRAALKAVCMSSTASCSVSKLCGGTPRRFKRFHSRTKQDPCSQLRAAPLLRTVTVHRTRCPRPSSTSERRANSVRSNTNPPIPARSSNSTPPSSNSKASESSGLKSSGRTSTDTLSNLRGRKVRANDSLP